MLVSIAKEYKVPRLDSVASAPAVITDEDEPKLQLVLLLMSPISFELVHTEVFVDRARVSDVLALIPQLASQESIRQQSYIGLCDYRNDKALNARTLISDVCSDNHEAADVVVALPNDLFVSECARRARHILRQVIPKVRVFSRNLHYSCAYYHLINMPLQPTECPIEQLKSNGTDVSHWLGSSSKPKKSKSSKF